jgi:hypothetical protein
VAIARTATTGDARMESRAVTGVTIGRQAAGIATPARTGSVRIDRAGTGTTGRTRTVVAIGPTGPARIVTAGATSATIVPMQAATVVTVRSVAAIRGVIVPRVVGILVLIARSVAVTRGVIVPRVVGTRVLTVRSVAVTRGVIVRPVVEIRLAIARTGVALRRVIVRRVVGIRVLIARSVAVTRGVIVPRVVGIRAPTGRTAAVTRVATSVPGMVRPVRTVRDATASARTGTGVSPATARRVRGATGGPTTVVGRIEADVPTRRVLRTPG